MGAEGASEGADEAEGVVEGCGVTEEGASEEVGSKVGDKLGAKEMRGVGGGVGCRPTRNRPTWYINPPKVNPDRNVDNPQKRNSHTNHVV